MDKYGNIQRPTTPCRSCKIVSKDKECQDIYEELMKLITPDTEFIIGEFRNLVRNY